MIEYGYIRVSTKEQNEDRQRIVMQNFGIPSRNIVLDEQSGKNFDRLGFQKLIKKIKPGDVLVKKASTGLAEIIMKFWSSGAISQKYGRRKASKPQRNEVFSLAESQRNGRRNLKIKKIVGKWRNFITRCSKTVEYRP